MQCLCVSNFLLHMLPIHLNASESFLTIKPWGLYWERMCARDVIKKNQLRQKEMSEFCDQEIYAMFK